MMLYEEILFMVQKADEAACAKGEKPTRILMNQNMLDVVREMNSDDHIGIYKIKVVDALPDDKIILE